MAQGRKTGGRKKGSKNSRTKVKLALVAEAAAAAGTTPLEVMLENMEFARTEAKRILGQLIDNGSDLPEKFNEFAELLRFRAMSQQAAKDAAPYMHPHLAAVAHTGSDGGAIQIERIERTIVSPKNRDA
jgi:hypothetical protein